MATELAGIAAAQARTVSIKSDKGKVLVNGVVFDHTDVSGILNEIRSPSTPTEPSNFG